MKIQIPEPCHEDWSKMTQTEKGRFCGSCAKEVVDFTEMSKNEIQQYFINKTTEATCGRIQNRQLVELNTEEKLTTRFIPKPWWIAAASIIFLVKPVLAQGFTQSTNKEVLLNSANSTPKVESEEQANLKREKFVISGVVTDSLTNEPLFSAIVFIKNTKIGCYTDFDGNFKFEYSAKYKDSVIVEIKILGYETKSIDVVLSEREINLDTIMLHTNLKINEIRNEIKIRKMGKMRITEAVMPESAMNEENTSTDSSVTVSGTVLNENGETLPFANVVIKGTDIGVTTDFNGAFKLEIPENLRDSLILLISYLGCDNREINLNDLARDFEIRPVYLTSNMTLHTVGGIYYQTPRQRFFSRIRGFFWRLFH